MVNVKNMIGKILDGLIEKKVSPKIFGIVFKLQSGMSFNIVTAYSLEEAHFKAIQGLQKQFPKQNFSEARIELYLIKEIGELLDGFVLDEVLLKTTPAVIPTPQNSLGSPLDLVKGKTVGDLLGTDKTKLKNELMQRIVKGKDNALLEENKVVFSEAEYKYLAEQIKNKKA